MSRIALTFTTLTTLTVLVLGCTKENMSTTTNSELHAATIEGATAASDAGRARELTEGATGEPVSIRLERKPCFGLCPSYVIEIAENGDLRFEGKRHVRRRGEQKKKLTSDQMDQLKKEFTDAGYFTMTWKNPCDRVWTDNPSVVTTLVLDGRKRTIDHYHGNKCFPAALDALENKIDEIAGTKEWVECGSTPSDRYCIQ